MLIAHVQTRWLNAGSEENILSSCMHQMGEGHTVIALVGRDSDPKALRKLEAAVSKVVVVPSMVHQISPRHDIRAVKEIKAIFAKERPDIVHTHQSKAGVLGRMGAKLANVPTIIHGIHIVPFANTGRLERQIYLTVEKFCDLFTTGYISVSPAVRDAYLEVGIGDEKNHFVALSAMNVDKFKAAAPPADWRELLHVAPDKPKPVVIVMMAAFEPRKRQLELIRALPNFLPVTGDWRLLFVGEGTTQTAARALVEELGLSDRVFFSGFRDDPEQLIALADICLLTSMREGLPRVVVQYAAAGKAMVVSDLLGLNYILQNSKNAIITPSEDVNAATAAVARLVEHPEERAALEAQAKMIPVDAWKPQSMNAAIDAAYHSLQHNT